LGREFDKVGGAEGFGGGEVREERGGDWDSDVEGGEVMGWWGLDTGGRYSLLLYMRHLAPGRLGLYLMISCRRFSLDLPWICE